MAEVAEILKQARAVAERCWVGVDDDGIGVGYGDVVGDEITSCCTVGDPERTKDEVLALFDCAIAKAEANG